MTAPLRLLAAMAALMMLPALSAAAAADSAADCRLRLVWTDLPPYLSSGPDGRPVGIDIDLMEEAGRRMPCAIGWEQAPRARAFALIQEGKVDAIVGAGRTAEREVYGIYSQPVREGRNVLVVRKGQSARFPYGSLTELAATGFRLGVTAGSRYSQEYEDLVRSGALADNIVTVQTGESAMTMLMRDRIDGFLEGYRVSMTRAQKLGLREQIEVHPMFVNEHKAFTLFSRAAGVDPAIITRYNAVILGMQADGTVDRIISNYGS